jgi:hypothetical protein
MPSLGKQKWQQMLCQTAYIVISPFLRSMQNVLVQVLGMEVRCSVVIVLAT